MTIQGLFGPIAPDALGQTLMHEHLTCADWSMRMNFGDKFFNFEQVARIAALCRAGWGERLLLSHDQAAYLAFWDSWETTKKSDWMNLEEDYTFIHRRVLPALEQKGLGALQIQGLLIDNPRRFFLG